MNRNGGGGSSFKRLVSTYSFLLLLIVEFTLSLHSKNKLLEIFLQSSSENGESHLEMIIHGMTLSRS